MYTVSKQKMNRQAAGFPVLCSLRTSGGNRCCRSIVGWSGSWEGGLLNGAMTAAGRAVMVVVVMLAVVVVVVVMLVEVVVVMLVAAMAVVVEELRAADLDTRLLSLRPRASHQRHLLSNN